MITLRSYSRLKLIALGVLAVASAGMVTYHLTITAPKQKCAEAGAWWSDKDRKCFAPVYLPSLTGRKPGESATIDWHEDKTAPVPTGTGR